MKISSRLSPSGEWAEAGSLHERSAGEEMVEGEPQGSSIDAYNNGVNYLDKCATCRCLYDCDDVSENVEDCGDYELDDACTIKPSE